MSAARSSMCSLQPSCSPKKATLGPMTGPQSTSTGDSHDDSAARNFGSAFDGTMASAVAADGEVSTPPPAWSGRLPPNFSRSVIATELTWTARRFTAPGHDGPVRRFVRLSGGRADLYRPSARHRRRRRRSAAHGGGHARVNLRGDLALRARAGRRRCGRRRRCRRLGFRLRFAALAARALHVDAAPEVRTLGDGHPWRGDVAVHRAVVADVDLLAGRDVAGHFAEDDARLREHLRLDAGVGTDRQHVLPQLDLAFDLTFDREVLASAQLALDYDGFADVHGRPLPLCCAVRLADGPRRLH